MGDVWNRVKKGTNHYKAYIPEDGFPEVPVSDSDRWIRLNLINSQTGEYERTVNSYKVYMGTSGIYSVGKKIKMRNMMTKRFSKKGFAIPYVLLVECDKRDIMVFKLEVFSNNDDFIAEIIMSVDYALENGRKIWESNSERQIFVPLDEWYTLKTTKMWEMKIGSMNNFKTSDSDNSQTTLDGYFNCNEKNIFEIEVDKI